MTAMDSLRSAAASSVTPSLSRTHILEVTARCLHEHGYDATTIRQIAGMLGCAVGSIYRYFRDKQELLLAVTEQLLEPVRVMIEEGATLRDSVSAYLDAAEADPQAYRLLFWLSCAGREPGKQVSPPIVSAIVAQWSQQLNDEALASRCWAMLHGSIMLCQDRQQILADVAMLTGGGDAGTRTAGQTATQAPSQQAPTTAPQVQMRDAGDDVTLL